MGIKGLSTPGVVATARQYTAAQTAAMTRTTIAAVEARGGTYAPEGYVNVGGRIFKAWHVAAGVGAVVLGGITAVWLATRGG